MLTRCKHGMFIITSHAFLTTGPGKNCLVGEFSQYVGNVGWLNMEEIESGEFLVNPRKREIEGEA